MEEVIFMVEESVEGGYIAKGLGVSIFTEADTIEELRISVKEAVKCHYDDDKKGLSDYILPRTRSLLQHENPARHRSK